jgi:hypothetical protein
VGNAIFGLQIQYNSCPQAQASIAWATAAAAAASLYHPPEGEILKFANAAAAFLSD